MANEFSPVAHIDRSVVECHHGSKSNYIFLSSSFECRKKQQIRLWFFPFSHLRQRGEDLLLDVPEELVDGKLKTLVGVELGNEDTHEDPAFPWRFGWRLIVLESRLIDTHRALVQTLINFRKNQPLVLVVWRRFTHLKWPLLPQLPTYYTIYDFPMLFSSHGGFNFS
jgi:hypothetical protein